MSPELLFTLINLSVLPAWLLLIFLPKSALTRKLVHSGVYPVGLGLFYLVVMGIAVAGGTLQPDDFFSASGISQLFQNPLAVLFGWAHYLVFDLFVGAWQARDGQRRNIAHGWMIPCLLLTFIYGPIGLLAYIILRAVLKQGQFSLWEDDPTLRNKSR